MLVKGLLLEDPVLPLKGVEQVEQHVPALQVVPHLDQIDPGVSVKEGVIEIEAVPLLEDAVPAAHIKVEISALPHQSVHPLQDRQQRIVFHIGQGVARAGHAVKGHAGPAAQIPEIALPQIHGPPPALRLFPAPVQHGPAEISPAHRHAQLQEGQRDAAGADAHVQQGSHVQPSQHVLPVLSVDAEPLLCLYEIVDIRPVI